MCFHSNGIDWEYLLDETCKGSLAYQRLERSKYSNHTWVVKWMQREGEQDGDCTKPELVSEKKKKNGLRIGIR